MPLHIQPTSTTDIDKIMAMESDKLTRDYIIPYTKTQHLHTIRNENESHLTILNGNNVLKGFAILAGLTDPNDVVECRRIVISDKGKGYGREALRLIKAYCFEDLGCNRLWLDVFEHNKRALRLYTTEGFIIEGLLRECVQVQDRYANLIIMSMLKSEYQKVQS